MIVSRFQRTALIWQAASLLIVSIFLLFVSCKGHLYRVPSHSMENTLMMGKLFSVTPVDDFRRNDIVVFSYFGNDYRKQDKETGQYIPEEHRRVYRIVALSGDKFIIEDGEIFVNDKHVPLPSTGKTDYEIFASTHIDELDNVLDNGGASLTQEGDTLMYYAPLTNNQVLDYEQRKPAILSVEKKILRPGEADTAFARGSATGSWSQDFYGPLLIPSPGDTINVDEINMKLYHNIPGIHPGKNVIKEKLYFVLGDNRHSAEDSRYIGLISGSKMYGIVK